MEMIYGDGNVRITTFPTYGETSKDIVDLTAVVSFAGQSIVMSLDGRPPESIMSDRFVVVLADTKEPNHYRFADVASEKISYDVENPPMAGIREVLRWKSSFMRGELKYAKGYAIYSIMRYCPATMDWVRSYMPKKRVPIPKDLRKRVYEKCGGHCAYCGRKIDIKEMQVDHVESHYRHQGRDELDNYLPACRDCNGLKSDYLLEEFRTVLIPNCVKKGKFCGSNGGRNARIAKAYGIQLNPKKKIIFYFEREGKHGK